MSQHSNAVTRIDRFVNYLIQLAAPADELAKQAFDVGLASATPAEHLAAITEAGLDYGDETTASATLLSAINLVGEIGNLAGNRAVAQADWLATMNKVNAGSGQSTRRVETLSF